MLLSQLKIQFIHQLKSEYPPTEIESFFYLLMEEYLGKTRLEMALEPGFEISEEQKARFEHALLRLKDHEPVQYITGSEEFYGLKFTVNKNVLIPRPETEELVAWVVNDFEGRETEFKILDIGTGSGCIAISLAHEFKKASVTAYDISEEALEIARINASSNDVEVDFQQIDILKLQNLPEKFDVIVSNPPYVRKIEKEQMHKNVLDHEPGAALYVEDEAALIFYEKIAALAAESLNPYGALYFEINQYLAEETVKVVEEQGFKAILKKDIFGNFRMLKAIIQ